MAENSKISWTDNTFSAWRGCLRVSEACRFCYADAFSHRNPKMLGVFGTEAQGGTRVVAADDYWQQPKAWNGIAQAERNLFEIVGECPQSTGEIGQRLQDPKVGEWLGELAASGVMEQRDNGFWYPLEYHAPRVFCASLSDVFEQWSGPMLNHKNERLYHFEGDWIPFHREAIVGLSPVTMDDVRARLFNLIDATPNLDWQLLTKRPESIKLMWKYRVSDYGQDSDPAVKELLKDADRTKALNYRPNVWLGTTIENQECANERLLGLLECSDMVPVLFLSMEPLLGPVDLEWPEAINPARMCCSGFECGCQGLPCDPPLLSYIQWVIVGCESGPNRRETKFEWVRSLRDQCKRWHVPFFCKQLEIDGNVTTDVNQFPEDLRIQEFPDG